jgi:hypothetical protein
VLWSTTNLTQRSGQQCRIDGKVWRGVVDFLDLRRGVVDSLSPGRDLVDFLGRKWYK